MRLPPFTVDNDPDLYDTVRSAIADTLLVSIRYEDDDVAWTLSPTGHWTAELLEQQVDGEQPDAYPALDRDSVIYQWEKTRRTWDRYHVGLEEADGSGMYTISGGVELVSDDRALAALNRALLYEYQSYMTAKELASAPSPVRL